MPIEQVENFILARPTSQRVELEAAPASDAGQFYLHGTLSEHGRGQYRAALGRFVDRAASAYRSERDATRTDCKAALVRQPVVG